MWQRGMDQKASAQPYSIPERKALLVDEYPEDLQFYSTILEAYGFRVRRCRTYLEGVRCLGEEAFDFVIVSQGTHSFEGSWVLMRAIEVNPSLPALVVARSFDIDCYQEAMQLGAMDYLVEPLTVWEIGRLLERSQRVKNLASSLGITRRRAAWEGRYCGPANSAEAVLERGAQTSSTR